MNVAYVKLLYFFINKVDNSIRFFFDAKMYWSLLIFQSCINQDINEAMQHIYLTNHFQTFFLWYLINIFFQGISFENNDILLSYVNLIYRLIYPVRLIAKMKYILSILETRRSWIRTYWKVGNYLRERKPIWWTTY